MENHIDPEELNDAEEKIREEIIEEEINADVDEEMVKEKIQSDIKSDHEAEIAEIKSQMLEYRERLARSQAEIENQSKRLAREIENASKYAVQDFISRMLPAKDSMEKAIDISYIEGDVDPLSMLKGIKATLKICDDAFLAVGVEEINPHTGEVFNPELHEAMSIKKSENQKPNIILTVFQKGYLLNGRLIRPARVEVSAN